MNNSNNSNNKKRKINPKAPTDTTAFKTSKAERLAQLVRGKTLLRESPNRRDVILHVYGVDIDRLSVSHTQCQHTDLDKEECERLQRYWKRHDLNARLNSLLYRVRDREYKKAVDEDSLQYHNEFQFYMILDKETKISHCVHIIQEINGDYLLDWIRRIEKKEKIAKDMVTVANLSTEEREQSFSDYIKEGLRRKLAKDYASDKQIRAHIKELRQAGKLPKHRSDYKSNIKGIRYVFLENASEIKLAKVKLTLKQLDRKDNSDSGMESVKVYKDGDNLIKNMIKEIILCDYHRRDYQLPEPDTEYLS